MLVPQKVSPNTPGASRHHRPVSRYQIGDPGGVAEVFPFGLMVVSGRLYIFSAFECVHLDMCYMKHILCLMKCEL